MPRKNFVAISTCRGRTHFKASPCFHFCASPIFCSCFFLPILNVKKTEELLSGACAPSEWLRTFEKKKNPFFWCQALLCTGFPLILVQSFYSAQSRDVGSESIFLSCLPVLPHKSGDATSNRTTAKHIWDSSIIHIELKIQINSIIFETHTISINSI